MSHKVFALFVVLFSFAAFANGQAMITVWDPTQDRPQGKLDPTINAAIEKAADAASKAVPADACTREVEIAGVATGAFTKPGARQSLAFYQYCQTGNGLGWVGLALIEKGSVIGNWVADAGWSNNIGSVADVNKNGLDEFTLVYSGGMHQGQGGTGVDLLEFAGGSPKAIGWYKAEEFGPTEASNAWKLTAKPGAVPVYYSQKYFSGENSKYKPVGRVAPVKLGKAISSFKLVK